MRYALTLLAGIWLGLAFSRIPHYPLFNDQPADPQDWAGPKMTGPWSDKERAVIMGRYFNGGKG